MQSLEVTSNADEIHRIGDVVADETSGFVTFIPRDRFAGRLTGLEQVIESETGVQVRQSGGVGSFSSLSLRGASNQQVMVYLDGLPLNEAAGGGVDLSQFNLSEIESIEIYRGIVPANFASASIGGALNIRSLRASDKDENSLSIGYGSFDTRQVGLLHIGGRSAWETLLSAQYLGTTNNFEFVNDNGTPLNPSDDHIDRRNNAQANQYNALLKLGRDIEPKLRFDGLVNIFSKDQGLPSVDNNPATKAMLDTLNLSSVLGLSAQRIRGTDWNARLRVFASQRRESFDDSRGQIGLGAQQTRDRTRRYGIQVFGERIAATHTLSTILDLSRETFDSEDLTQRREDLLATRQAIESAMQATVYLLDDRLLVTPILRLQAYRDRLDNDVSTDAEGYLSPQFGAKYRLADGLIVKSNIGRYIRLPSFFELFGDRGFVMGNGDLEAEQGLNFDAGVELQRVFRNAALRELNLKLGYFYSEVDDLIALVFDARGVGRPVNIANAEIQGVELGSRLSLSSETALILNATWQDPVNRSQISAFDGKRLPGRYETMVMLRLEQFISRFKLFYQFRFESGLFYDSANLLQAKDVREHGLGMETVWDPLQLSFELRNLGNENFEEFNGFPTPGRSFFAKLSYQF